MAIHSKFLGSVTVTGDDAKSFERKLSHGRATKASAVALDSGLKMSAALAKRGVVAFKVAPTRAEPTSRSLAAQTMSKSSVAIKSRKR